MWEEHRTTQVAQSIDTTNSFSFDPVANTIGTITAIPRATGETRALNVGGQMWVMGGGRVAPNPSTEIDIYDPGSNAWTIGIPFTTARRNFPTDTDGSTIWLGGGYDSSGVNPLQSMEIFTPGAPCTTSTPVPPTSTATSVPPSNTPTSTSVPASNTPTARPPTQTPGGNTATPVPSNTYRPHPDPGRQYGYTSALQHAWRTHSHPHSLHTHLHGCACRLNILPLHSLPRLQGDHQRLSRWHLQAWQ